MERILLDTSVYGELIEELEIVDAIVKHIPKDIIIYGNRIIRNELRAVSKKVKIEGRSKRILLLDLYDLFIKKDNHDLKITDLIEIIANDYYIEYKKIGGITSYKKIISDFKIVACASLHSLDIVISHDTASMLSDKSVLAYKKINQKYQLKTPNFITYLKFKERFV